MGEIQTEGGFLSFPAFSMTETMLLILGQFLQIISCSIQSWLKR